MSKLSECEKGYRRWISPENKSQPYKPKPTAKPRKKRKRKPPSLGFTLSEAQVILKKKHGTPAEFAAGTYQAVPAFISMEEAAEAVRKYQKEWDQA